MRKAGILSIWAIGASAVTEKSKGLRDFPSLGLSITRYVTFGAIGVDGGNSGVGGSVGLAS